MKKTIVILFLLLFCTAYAQSFIGMGISEYSPDDQNISFMVASNKDPDDAFNFQERDIVECFIVSKVPPKVGKFKGFLRVEVVSVTREGKTINLEDKNITAKITMFTEKDMKEIGKNAALNAGLTVGSHFVTGLSSMFYFAKGVVQNKDDNRLKSGVVEAYENSPLSYIEKGDEFHLSEGELIKVKFKAD